MSISRNLVTIYKAFNKYLNQFYAKEGFGEITANSYQYLIAVYKLHRYENLATVTGVANKLGVKKPSAIQMVNGLMQSGYLIKKNSETDKRVFSLELSEKGFKMMRLEEAFSNEFLRLFYDSLTTDEIELLEKITEKIASKIEAEGNI